MSRRLLFLTAESCPTFRADVAVLFGKYLPRLGIDTDVVAARTPGSKEPVSWGGGQALLCDIGGGLIARHVKTFVHALARLWAADPSRYQAIQVRDMPVVAALALIAARFKRLPFIYWMSYPIPEGQIELARERKLSAGWMKFLFPWVSGHVGRFLLNRFVLSNATHVFVQSERMKQDLEERGIPGARMTPVPMGVDLESFAQPSLSPSEHPKLVGKRVIAYLGTLDRPRRIEILFEMLALLRKRLPATLLVLVGDTADEVHRDWLHKQAVISGVDDAIVWSGWLPTFEAWQLVAAAEVALSPFPRGHLLDSASPTKVPEYLALGLPVVCNDNPDQQQVIAESGAGRCVPYTASAFADAVEELLEIDPATRASMQFEGKRFVAEKRGYQLLAASVARTYERLLDPALRSVRA